MSFFFGPGGFGGPGMGGMGGDVSDGESADSTKYYQVLGLEKSASPTEIKKAFRKLARQLHPDKHPGEEDKYQAKFQELQRAYEVLSDPEKKKLYDRYGEAGLKGGGGMGGGSDIFDMFFGGHGGHGGRGRQQRRKKAPAIREFLDVTLEDLYLGSCKEVSYEKMTVCTPCNGKGGTKVVECSACNGQGVQVVLKRMGPMTVQTQRECPRCNGEGTSIPEGFKCKKCRGKGMNKVSKHIDFPIPRGSKHAQKIVLSGQGHEIPDAVNGDVVIVLRCVKHAIFQRVGADLAMTKKISLKEALCGFEIVVPHLSGFRLKIRSEPKEITSHGSLKAVYSKGMPQKGGSNTYGHLYVKFEIVFPEELDDETRAQIAELLPPGPDELDPNEVEEEIEYKEDMDAEEEAEMHRRDLEDHETAETVHGEPKVTPASARSIHDEDEEDGDGVQCRQM